MIDTTYIYALLDPDTEEIRYIGKADNPEKRLKSHIYEAKKNPKKSHKRNWIRSLLRDGKIPKLIILSEVSSDIWTEEEKRLIAEFKNAGKGLTNTAEGGAGPSGFKHTEEAKEKISKAFKGENHPMYGVKGEDNPLWGKIRSTEACEKIRQTKIEKYGLKTKVYKNLNQSISQNRPEVKQRKIDAMSKVHHYALSPDGEYFEFMSLRNFCREHGLQQASMQRVAAGKQGKHKGWTCGYKEQEGLTA